MSRRAETLEVPRPRSSPGAEPLHLLVDSTDLRLCGAGEWLHEKHDARLRRSWRRLHFGMDAGTGQIVASLLTARDADDGAQIEPLLDQVESPLASFIGDGANNQEGATASIGARHPEAAIIVLPRSNAVPSASMPKSHRARLDVFDGIVEAERLRYETGELTHRVTLSEVVEQALAALDRERMKREDGTP